MDAQLPPRVPRWLATAVALVEAAAVLLFAVLLTRNGWSGGAVDVSAAYLQAAIAGFVAVALSALGVALARGRRWPGGIFVTAQLLIAVVALSQLGTALRNGREESVMLVIPAVGLVVAGAGLWSAVRLAAAHHRMPPGPAAPGPG